MDNIRFGSFVAQLRKERGLTQKELAQRLHVTDKAVSKWETGRGFPDLKLLDWPRPWRSLWWSCSRGSGPPPPLCP